MENWKDQIRENPRYHFEVCELCDFMGKTKSLLFKACVTDSLVSGQYLQVVLDRGKINFTPTIQCGHVWQQSTADQMFNCISIMQTKNEVSHSYGKILSYWATDCKVTLLYRPHYPIRRHSIVRPPVFYDRFPHVIYSGLPDQVLLYM